MAVKKTHGGTRKGAGRKKVSDKKEPVFIYVRRSVIDKNGGKQTLKRILEEHVNEES